MGVQSKGSGFEREVAVKLSQWVTHGEKKDVFWRTAMSGGRSTVFRKKGSLYRQSGDLCAVSPEGHSLTETFYFELKFYKSLELPSFFMKGTGLMGGFLKKAREEAKFYKLKPILIVKQNQFPALFIVGRSQIPQPWLSHVVKTKWAIHLEHFRCSVYRLDDILQSRYVPYVRRIRLED